MTTTGVARPRGRRVLWILLVLLLVLVAAAAWLALGLKSAIGSIKQNADAAQQDLLTAKRALESGDQATARAAASSAQNEVAAARASAAAMPVRLVGHLPVVGAAVGDLDHLIDAAQDLASASTQAVTVYSTVVGTDRSAGTLFHNGEFNFTVLDSAQAAAVQVDGLLNKAEISLNEVQATSPGTSSLAAARDKALAQIIPLRNTVNGVSKLFPLLPKALGRGTTVNYLLTVDNEGQMRSSGGAPLYAAMVRVTNGKVSVPIQGQVSTKIFPRNRLLSWQHVIPAAWPDSVAPRFLSANIHPDYVIAGQEMMRAWEAGGKGKLNGVISIDMNAFAAVLKVTGPMDTKSFGKIDSSNLVSKILVDAYQQFAANQNVRHSLNQDLAAQVVTELTSGRNLLGIVKALLSVAPGRHLQMYLSAPGLQQQVVAAGMSGALPTAPGDRLDVYSLNGNGGKLDVFQKRAISERVVLAADGSALVTRTVVVHNDTPKQLSATARGGYLTAWSSGLWYFYLPDRATAVVLKTPAGFTVPSVFVDGVGGQAMQVSGDIRPDGTATFTMTYSLPAGYFAHGVYTGTASPQPTLLAATLAVTVVRPDGSIALLRPAAPFNAVVSLRSLAAVAGSA